MSNRWNWNSEDTEKWLKNFILFSSPALIAFLTALQGGADMDFALGAGYSALLAGTIDLVKKLYAGEQK